ncbi:DUF952 domain-containing protein [Nocardioides terrisoli]|uniref:DUF952 domain-containing protein n=1 Tax=Nocardioides terrisoli TaxID=3388267 RepID=UPI00287B5F1C|nr:DUF952 domain-containing protein [Nocardioides marmorisolisilvae]
MRIFHIAQVDDWAAARAAGHYDVSTNGLSLSEVGFIHAARAEQVAGVFARFYRGHGQELVLLAIETERLDVPWSEDPAPDRPGETFPHIHGPLPTRAVVQVTPLDGKGRPTTLGALFFRAMVLRMLALLLVLVGAAVGAGLGSGHGPGTAVLGAVLGAAVGGGLGYAVIRLSGRG